MENRNEQLLQLMYRVFDLSKRSWKRNHEGGEGHTGHHKNKHEGHHGHREHDKLRGVSLARSLAAIEKNPGMKPSELASILEIRPQSVTGLVDRLCEHEFVERKTDEEDRRVLRLYLTEKGVEAKEHAAAYQKEVADNFFSEINDDEKETLLTLLQKLAEANSKDV